jgi:hypothetical protein
MCVCLCVCLCLCVFVCVCLCLCLCRGVFVSHCRVLLGMWVGMRRTLHRSSSIFCVSCEGS